MMTRILQQHNSSNTLRRNMNKKRQVMICKADCRARAFGRAGRRGHARRRFNDAMVAACMGARHHADDYLAACYARLARAPGADGPG